MWVSSLSKFFEAIWSQSLHQKVSENHLKLRNFYPILPRFFEKSAFRCFPFNKKGLRRRTITKVGALESSVFGEPFQYNTSESQATAKCFEALWSQSRHQKVSENHLKLRHFYPILPRFFQKSAFRCFSCNKKGLGRHTVTKVSALESSVFGEPFQYNACESQAAQNILKSSEVKVFTKK